MLWIPLAALIEAHLGLLHKAVSAYVILHGDFLIFFVALPFLSPDPRSITSCVRVLLMTQACRFGSQPVEHFFGRTNLFIFFSSREINLPPSLPQPFDSSKKKVVVSTTALSCKIIRWNIQPQTPSSKLSFRYIIIFVLKANIPYASLLYQSLCCVLFLLPFCSALLLRETSFHSVASFLVQDIGEREGREQGA